MPHVRKLPITCCLPHLYSIISLERTWATRLMSLDEKTEPIQINQLFSFFLKKFDLYEILSTSVCCLPLINGLESPFGGHAIHVFQSNIYH